MRSSHARLGTGMAALAGLWIAVYWWWDPAPEPAVRFDTAAQTGPEPAPADPVDPAGSSGAPTGPSGGQGDAPPGGESGAGPEPVGVLPPDFWDYTVEEGEDSLEVIAEKLFGDREAWAVIAQSNPLKDPARIRPGQVWRIPLDAGNIQGVVVDASGRPVAEVDPAPEDDGYIEYIVQAGDSLSAISTRFYATSKHADFLFEYNRRRLGLRSPDAITVGQVLRAPKAPPGR